MEEYVVFTLSERKYAITLLNIVEILLPSSVYPIPNSAPNVLGLTNIRGNILPVLDIKPLLGEDGENGEVNGELTRHIWVNTGTEDIVVVVDKVNGIKRVSEDNLAEPPEDLAAGRRIRKVILLDNDLILVIDPLDLMG
ncbi:MAG TPA: chemotaxis protein CheW [Coprothermobacter sp.]|nr:chemotaxis protein CheW [Coprothermobacter sp.]